MSYTTNINQIDSELKKVFSNVVIDNTDFRQLNIKLSNPIYEGADDSLEMRLFVSQSNLNNINPVLEWGYYSDPLSMENSIKFRTPTSNLSEAVYQVVKNNRFSEKYLEGLKNQKEEKLNENVSTENIEEDQITNINQVYDLSENQLKVNASKFKKFLENKFGFIIDNEDLTIDHRDVSSGKVRKPSFAGQNLPERGDEAEISINGLSSKSYDGEISVNEWLMLEKEIRKIPFVEDVFISTSKNNVSFYFSTKVFVELV